MYFHMEGGLISSYLLLNTLLDKKSPLDYQAYLFGNSFCNFKNNSFAFFLASSVMSSLNIVLLSASRIICHSASDKAKSNLPLFIHLIQPFCYCYKILFVYVYIEYIDGIVSNNREDTLYTIHCIFHL